MIHKKKQHEKIPLWSFIYLGNLNYDLWYTRTSLCYVN